MQGRTGSNFPEIADGPNTTIAWCTLCNMADVPGDPLEDHTVRTELELLAKRLGMETGHWTLLAEFRDGELRQASRRHGPIGRDELEGLSTG